MVPVHGGRAILDQGAPGHEQLLKVIQGLAHRGACLEFAECSEVGQHGRIDGVGLGSASNCFGKTPGLKRVDLDHWQPGLPKAPFESVVIGAGGFKDEALSLVLLGEPVDQGCEAFAVVGEPARQVVRVEVDVEHVFRDVDADSLGYRESHLFQVLCLSSGPRRPSIRAGHKEKRGAVTL